MVTPPGRSCFASGDGEGLALAPGDGLASGLSVGEGLAVASGDGLGVTLGDGLGDAVFPRFGEGDGELFVFGVGEGAGVWAGEVVGFGELAGFGVVLGDAFGFGEGAGVGDLFFFEPVEPFRFFGAGVGSKMLLILSPNDCASAAGEPKKNASVINAQQDCTPARVIPSQRRRRGTSRGVLGAGITKDNPSTLREVLRRASPASG